MTRITPCSTSSARAGAISPVNLLSGNSTIRISTGPTLIRRSSRASSGIRTLGGSVDGMEFLEAPLLGLLRGTGSRRAPRPHDGHDPRDVRPVLPVDKRRLGGLGDLLAYCGYSRGDLAALENDFVSWLCTLSVIWSCADDGAAAMAAPTADAYPAVRSAPMIDCMMAPPRSRWRSAVPDAMPARARAPTPVSECDAGVPANPTPMPTNAYPRPTFQYEMPSFHSTSMVTKPSSRTRSRSAA